MFDRFQEGSRQAMVLAREQAQAWGHDYIGAEHILLALLQDEDTVARQVLVRCGADTKEIRSAIERSMRKGDAPGDLRQLPFTPDAKRTLEESLACAQRIGNSWIGPEHLLVGLLASGDGEAARALRAQGLRVDQVEEEIRRVHLL